MIPVLDNQRARQIFLARHGLARDAAGSDLPTIMDRLGFVQLDSVNTFARAHDLILWSRRGSYRPRQLELALARDRHVFEHWTHDASSIPIAFFPHWRLRFDRDRAHCEKRWTSSRRGSFLTKVDEVMRHIQDNGCCTSADVGRNEEKSSGGWWDWHPSKTALEYLWLSGELSVARREGFRKVYDLTERVIPPEMLNARPTPDETINWLCNAALDRLGFGTSGEIAAFWATVSKDEAKAWCAAALSAGEIIEIDITCVDGKHRRVFARPDIVDETPPEVPGRVRILSPFDPALRDRKRAERLFGFHYRIEIFVPAPKRQYGYYVFPVMEGDRLIGRIDMKREGDTLAVRRFWPEHGVRTGTGRLRRIAAELERAARFGGCSDISYGADWLAAA